MYLNMVQADKETVKISTRKVTRAYIFCHSRCCLPLEMPQEDPNIHTLFRVKYCDLKRKGTEIITFKTSSFLT